MARTASEARELYLERGPRLGLPIEWLGKQVDIGGDTVEILGMDEVGGLTVPALVILCRIIDPGHMAFIRLHIGTVRDAVAYQSINHNAKEGLERLKNLLNKE